MNANGFIRGHLAKNLGTDDFIKVVLTSVERELTDQGDSVKILGYVLADQLYFQVQVFTEQNGAIAPSNEEYEGVLSYEEASVLQQRSPYALDRKIWTELIRNGLQLQKKSHYIQTVLN